MHKIKNTILITIILLLFIGCSRNTGSITFQANGEDFVTNGFISRDGWAITFDKVLINLSSITAYNIHNEKLNVSLPDTYLIDLTSSSIIDVDTVSKVVKGNYQSLKFNLKQLQSGPYKGYSIIMVGTALKDGEMIEFSIKLSEELTFDGQEGYVGDSIKGLLNDKETTVEMTFHFDHIFGDIYADTDAHVNTGSSGFDFFIPFNNNGKLDVEQKQLNSIDGYNKLIKSIESLGHLGEGHCEVVR